ncbi:MAG: haloalkane dehalogenase, partial [Dehalococcoidia bacterium]|nr:haloalkane dehalogenase [Dehalococcoidia bacterium]
MVLSTSAGVEFVRTPEERFAELEGWGYETQYVEIDGLRMAWVDEGPSDAAPILLLHGEP